jgi:putative ribosome biogenesis GTPase RsgA
MTSLNTIPGWVISLTSGFYTVQTAGRTVTCQLRGRLKRGRAGGDVISVGDRVQIHCLPDGSGMVEEIDPRQRSYWCMPVLTRLPICACSTASWSSPRSSKFRR